MKIFIAFKTAAKRSLRSWKGILIIWFFSLLLVSLLAIPMKSALNSGFSSSMITEKLNDGINLEVFSDLGGALKSIISFFSSGFFLLLIAGFIINAFLSGGLFSCLKGSSGKFSAEEFFRASAVNFWSFLVILLIISSIIFLLAIVVIVLPMTLVSNSEIPQEGSLFRTFIIVAPVYSILLALLLLVADYARAWQVSKEQNACFKAVGYGFARSFKTFLSSFPLMILVLLVQVLYGWLVLSLLSEMRPVTGGGVLLLFLLSQVLFIVKIALKVWRYGSVTSLMEMN